MIDTLKTAKIKSPAASEASSKQEKRFNARLSEGQKALLQSAADLKGMTLSDFILGTAHDEAVRTIEAHEIIRLSRRDSMAFIAALEEPRAATTEIIERFARARKHLSK